MEEPEISADEEILETALAATTAVHTPCNLGSEEDEVPTTVFTKLLLHSTRYAP
jgi:hypothetical protein